MTTWAGVEVTGSKVKSMAEEAEINFKGLFPWYVANAVCECECEYWIYIAQYHEASLLRKAH